MDPLTELDWAAHWKGLVEARNRRRVEPRRGDFWDARAARFARSIGRQEDPFWKFLEPRLRPTQTVIDVGAGVGRHTIPLAGRVDWVTAVEPSAGMRQQIPPLPNVTVIGSSWEDAEPAPADLVICVHVLYGVPDPAPFLEKLDRSARERVFVVLRDSERMLLADRLAAVERPREPLLRDCFLLLRQLGIPPDVTMYRYPTRTLYDSVEEAAEECRDVLGQDWDEERGRAWLETNLRAQEDGTLLYEAGEVTAGVLHWKPAS